MTLDYSEITSYQLDFGEDGKNEGAITFKDGRTIELDNDNWDAIVPDLLKWIVAQYKLAHTSSEPAQRTQDSN